jgi:hypothetical protein
VVRTWGKESLGTVGKNVELPEPGWKAAGRISQNVCIGSEIGVSKRYTSHSVHRHVNSQDKEPSSGPSTNDGEGNVWLMCSMGNQSSLNRTKSAQMSLEYIRLRNKPGSERQKPHVLTHTWILKA